MMCECGCFCHCGNVTVNARLSVFGSLLHLYMGSRDWTQVVRLGSSCQSSTLFLRQVVSLNLELTDSPSKPQDLPPFTHLHAQSDYRCLLSSLPFYTGKKDPNLGLHVTQQAFYPLRHFSSPKIRYLFLRLHLKFFFLTDLSSVVHAYM